MFSLDQGKVNNTSYLLHKVDSLNNLNDKNPKPESFEQLETKNKIENSMFGLLNSK